MIIDPNVKNEGEVNGIKFNTMYYDPKQKIDLDTINQIREEFYDFSNDAKIDMLHQLKDVLLKKKWQINLIYRWYFESIANDCKYQALFSINEVLENDTLMQIVLNKVLNKPDVFSEENVTDKIKTCFRIGAKPFAGKLSNYPFRQCADLIKKHRLKNNDSRRVYIDPCCGWGVRMLSSAVLGMDYVGFDVNPQLIESLKEFGKMIQRFRPEFKFTIIEHGSEIFVPELVNTADVIFTSPPYYQLEDYGKVNDGAIEIMNISYEEWNDTFVKPMLNNMIKYAKKDSRIMINIKNIRKYPMFDDFAKVLEDSEFTKRLKDDSMENIKRVMKTENIEEVDFDTDEKIMVFKKIKE